MCPIPKISIISVTILNSLSRHVPRLCDDCVTVTHVCILGRVLASAKSTNIDVVEHDITGVSNEVVVLRTISEDKVGYDTVLEPVHANQHGP